MSKKRSPPLGGGSSSNPRAGSGGSTFQACPFVRAATCIAAWSRSVSKVRGAIVGGRASSGARANCLDGGDALRLEPQDLVAPHPRDEAEVVVVAPAVSQRCRKSQRSQNETGSG